MSTNGTDTEAASYFDGTNTEMLRVNTDSAETVRRRPEFWREPTLILSRVVDAGMAEIDPDVLEAS